MSEATYTHEAAPDATQAQQTAQDAPTAQDGYNGAQNGHHGQRGGYNGQRGYDKPRGYNGNGGKPKPRGNADPNGLKQNNNSEIKTFEEYLKRGKREFIFHLTSQTLTAELVELGQYTYTVRAKGKSGAMNTLVLQKHAVLFVNLGELPPQPPAQG